MKRKPLENFTINGIRYDSPSQAAIKTGIPRDALMKHLRSLRDSKLNELEVVIKIPKAFTLKKL